jgi:transcriptional regulator with XRE-family HTH domain
MGQLQYYSVNSNSGKKHPNSGYLDSIGLRLRKLRENRNMTQLELGKLLNYKQNSISRKESGVSQISSIEVVNISRVLSLTSSELIYLLLGVDSG